MIVFARPEIPQFELPLRFEDGDFSVMEQETSENVAQCTEVVLRYPLGWRSDLPAFGLSDLAFSRVGSGPAEVAEAIETWEPRAEAELSDELLDDTIERIGAVVGG